jgi:hypothetical protein
MESSERNAADRPREPAAKHVPMEEWSIEKPSDVADWIKFRAVPTTPPESDIDSADD